MRVIEVQTGQQDRRYVLVDDDGELVIPAVRFLKHLDQRGYARNTLRSYAHMLKLYFEYVGERKLDYRNPTLDDIGLFVHWLKLPSGSMKVLPAQPVDQVRANRTINHALTVVSGLYDYLWRIDDVAVRLADKTTTYLPAGARRYKGFLYHIAAQQPVAKKLFKQKEPKEGHSKTIPKAEVRELMFEHHIHDLPPRYIPLAIILRATGWRISDVLLLRMETCLVQSEKGWWICGDITKTSVLGHKVPITKEVAEVIEAQCAWVKQTYAAEINPKGYLFPSIYGRTKQLGRPMTIRGVNNAFQKLAQQYCIAEENGKIFHIHTHAFRHTKAVELLNNGMSLIIVQQWMAHASPEMTLIYAKILDDTMHKQWDQTMKQGAVSMGAEGGKPQRVEGKKVLDMLSSNALDVERVREHRIVVKLPIGNCCKTPKIICRFVELPCFNCPAYVLTPDDLPALEAYEEQIRQRIEVGKSAGHMHWVEANQNLLEQKVLPSIELLGQGQTLSKEDKYVREYTPEEWAARQKEEGA